MALRRILDHISQTWPPKPAFTERDIPDLAGKVYVVTGANTGIGKELARVLYTKNARVYVTARSQGKGDQAIRDIKEAVPQSQGELLFVALDLNDLQHVKAAAEHIAMREQRIHVLFNNAGVMLLGEPERTVQGYEGQLGVNNVGTHLFTKILTPTLVETAKTERPGDVRVVWVSSSGAETPRSPPGGVPLDNLDYHEAVADGFTRYAISKAGVYYQGTEFARRHKAHGIISMPVHPGILNTNLFRTAPALVRHIFTFLFTYPAINGAYTELFAGLSPAITLESSGNWGRCLLGANTSSIWFADRISALVVPWGRFMSIRHDLKEGSRLKEEGGTGIAKEFWDWNEAQVRSYVS
ncbi:short-chain dehydrogenase [Apiospora rasikravindrae]|uniref:Short-chain dehydrogenase n=1 Tax=Apiospora rasikravindrae TaxID=990691 RepID=A0ABR1U9L9_9PEZI